jgi:hypothetical protein
MPLLDTIIGGNVGDLFQKIVGTFRLSPEKAAEMREMQDQHAVDLQKIQLDLQAKAEDALSREIEAASANIRAEATTGDKYTSRARPSFIYIMLGILLANYVAFPLLRMPPLQFPDALFWLFGSCMLGYTGARTWEKVYQGQAK